MIDAVRAGQLLERLNRVQERGGYNDDDFTGSSYREQRELLETVILLAGKGGLAVHSWDRHQVYRAVDRERQRQDTQWGADADYAPLRWLRILVEEIGEVAQALDGGTEAEVRTELVQVAASAVWWLECQVRDRDAATEGCTQADAQCAGPVTMAWDGLLCTYHRRLGRETPPLKTCERADANCEGPLRWEGFVTLCGWHAARHARSRGPS